MTDNLQSIDALAAVLCGIIAVADAVQPEPVDKCPLFGDIVIEARAALSRYRAAIEADSVEDFKPEARFIPRTNGEAIANDLMASMVDFVTEARAYQWPEIDDDDSPFSGLFAIADRLAGYPINSGTGIAPNPQQENPE